VGKISRKYLSTIPLQAFQVFEYIDKKSREMLLDPASAGVWAREGGKTLHDFTQLIEHYCS